MFDEDDFDREPTTPEEACDYLESYAVEVRGDWSDFDGRTLLGIVRKCLTIIRPALEEKPK